MPEAPAQAPARAPTNPPAAYVTIAATATVLRSAAPEAIGLSADETSRAQRLLRAGDRDDFVAARALMRALLDHVCGLPGEPWQWTQVCDRCGGPHGQPRLASHTGVHISWAHTAGLVAAAASPVAIGVDVEHLALTPPPVTAWAGAPVLHQWLGWTRAEALVKHGAGVVLEGRHLPIDLDAALALPLAGPAVIGCSIEIGPDHAAQPVTDVVGPDWVASVVSAAPVQVVSLRRGRAP